VGVGVGGVCSSMDDIGGGGDGKKRCVGNLNIRSLVFRLLFSVVRKLFKTQPSGRRVWMFPAKYM